MRSSFGLSAASSRVGRTARMLACGLCLGLVVPTTGWAQQQPPATEDERIATATAKVEEGQALYEQAKYEEALAAFQDAAAAYASADFQFNIGLCYERLGEPESAIRAFETYLRNKPEASDRLSVEHRISQLRAEVQAAKNPPPPATPPPAVASPAQPVPAQPVAAAPVSDAGVAGRPHRPLVIAGSVALGVGIAAAVGGGVGFGLPAADRKTSVDAVLSGGNPEGLTRQETEAVASEGDRFRTFQIATVSAGALTATIGVVLLSVGLQRRRQNARAAVVPAVSPRFVGLQGSWVF